MHGGYTNEAGELVLEFAVPGRTAEEVDVTVIDDENLTVISKGDPEQPQSLRGREFRYVVMKFPKSHKIEEAKAQCKDGMLIMVFPANPTYQQPAVAPLDRELLVKLASNYRWN